VVLGHSLDGTQDQLDHHRQENERQFHISRTELTGQSDIVRGMVETL
jgi:hypothetical protein